MKKNIKPFGLLFEEEALQPINKFSPRYDEEESLSYIEILSGEIIPFVEVYKHLLKVNSNLNERESTDIKSCVNIKYSLSSSSTQTLTAVRKESTDSDWSNDLVNNTIPSSYSQNQHNRKENNLDINTLIQESLAATNTGTKVAKEITDQD